MYFVFYIGFMLVFGLLRGLFRRISDEKLLVRRQITLFKTTFFILFGTLIYFLFSKMIFLICSLGVLVFLGFIFQFFLKKYREKQFQEATLEFISGIILKMKSGESFRNAFYEEVQGSEGYFREQIQIIYKTVVYSQHNVELTTNKLSSEFVLLLKKVDLQPHLSIRLLENYRKLKFKLKTIRRRSQESLRSIRAQSVLLGLFYMILLVFSLTNYNFNQYLEVYLASLVLFIFGITISVNIGGRVKWKV